MVVVGVGGYSSFRLFYVVVIKDINCIKWIYLNFIGCDL